MAKRRIGGAGGGSDPGPGKSGGAAVAAVVLAGAMAAAGGGATLGGASSTVSSIDSATGRNLNAKKADAKSSARRGDAEDAWRRLSMRTIKKVLKEELACVTHSFGQVRDFFVRTPCRALDEAVFAIGDEGSAVIVSVAWVGFRNSEHARDFQRVIDVYGTGDVTPLGGAVLGMADVHFTGQHYQSRRENSTVVIAEAEALTGHVDNDVLDTVAEVAVLLPR
ncbi:hypothetical protein [Kutzneria albida]|uniref:Uncharacterized protein n=1 Tax=Kutzneria albida DSM 43870 TaxID=1449976 RepID=W5WNX6_9PSEU|nr:hypothetical protein [Kutzneria albida]AHH99874.1 hypothetical protein KALB_6515 [Kutzneria albida DSM 43870]